MSSVRRVIEDDGTYRVTAADRTIRGSATSEDAGNVITMPEPMDAGAE
jgi:hypothetical protein